MYSSELFNYIERNYNTTKKEVLIMVYALHKFRHYMLGNKFTFFMDHMAIDSGKLVRWLILFLEYDFKIVYKPSRSHLMANALSKLTNHIEHVQVLDQTCDVPLFTLQLQWL
jgi:hypothetical protein